MSPSPSNSKSPVRLPQYLEKFFAKAAAGCQGCEQRRAAIANAVKTFAAVILPGPPISK